MGRLRELFPLFVGDPFLRLTSDHRRISSVIRVCWHFAITKANVLGHNAPIRHKKEGGKNVHWLCHDVKFVGAYRWNNLDTGEARMFGTAIPDALALLLKRGLTLC